MAISLIPLGASAAARALIKSPAGQKVAAKGPKAVRDFLEKKGLYSRGTGKKAVKGSNSPKKQDKKSGELINPNYVKPKTKGKAQRALRMFEGNKPKAMTVDKVKGSNKTIKDAKKEVITNRRGQRANRFGYEGLKAGGLIKKKSIDGIAKRGKTKLKRVKG